MNNHIPVLSYALVVFLGAVSPGPDFALVTRHAALTGRRAGLAAALGIGAGMGVNTLAALLGMGAVIAASAQLYTVIRLVGAAYLVYLGISALLSLRRRPAVLASAADRAPEAPAPLDPSDAEPAAAPATAGSAFRQGLVTNILNPKAVVFLVALMPQFLPTHPSVTDRLLLGSVTVGVVTCWFLLVATAVSGLRRVFRRPTVQRGLNAVTGGVLTLLGVRLALS